MKDVCDFTHLACEAHFKAPTLAFWLGAMFFGRFVFVTSDHIWLRGMECFVNSSTSKMHSETLSGDFVRCTLLVPGWTLFQIQNCLNSS